MKHLFQTLQIGDLSLPNRIIMAPLTRCRASEGRLPNAMMAEYYAQRAGAGLILSEAVAVTAMGVGYPDTPGIWNEEQTDAWRQVTEAVHEKGGRIFMQLWHVGRISHPVYLHGKDPVAPSAVRPRGFVSRLRPRQPFVTPRALETAEVRGTVEAYRKGAENAKAAGFDGVEIHGANGYLPDQFLQDSTNLRTDEYGGSLENRARFMLEITDAAISVWGAGRVGMHLAPRCDSHDMGDSDPKRTFSYLASELGKRGIAFIFTREHFQGPVLTPHLKKSFGGPVFANEQFDAASAEQVLAEGHADAVSFGKDFISNPDLPERFRQAAALQPYDKETFYSGGPRGYTDYPSLFPGTASEQ